MNVDYSNDRATRSGSRMPSRKRIAALLWGAARVQVYLTCVVAVLLVVTSAAAYNRAKRVPLELGATWASELAPLSGQVERVLVNGAEFSFAALVVDGDASVVLNKVERDCNQRSGDLVRQFGEIAKLPQVHAAVPNLDLQKLTTGRRDGVGANGLESGDVVCALRDSSEHEPGILARLKSFSETGNLSDFGKMRYIRADQLPHSKGTRLLALWTDDPLNLERMFSETHDASGSDPVAVPRPPAARRVFSGVVPRSGDGVYGYDSSAAPGEVLGFYTRTLASAHWTEVKLALQGQAAPLESRAFLREGRATLVSASRERRSDPTTVAVVVLEARRVVSVSR